MLYNKTLLNLNLCVFLYSINNASFDKPSMQLAPTHNLMLPLGFKTWSNILTKGDWKKANNIIKMWQFIMAFMYKLMIFKYITFKS